MCKNKYTEILQSFFPELLITVLLPLQWSESENERADFSYVWWNFLQHWSETRPHAVKRYQSEISKQENRPKKSLKLKTKDHKKRERDERAGRQGCLLLWDSTVDIKMFLLLYGIWIAQFTWGLQYIFSQFCYMQVHWILFNCYERKNASYHQSHLACNK